MNNKKINFPDMNTERSSQKNEDDNPDRRNPKRGNPPEEKGPRIREIPISGSSDHPHNEEILDGIPS